MDAGSYHYRLLTRGDFSAFWALFTDNLVNLLILSGVCRFVFQMPEEIVFGRIVPGAAVAILAGVVVHAWLARQWPGHYPRLNEQSPRHLHPAAWRLQQSYRRD